MNLLNPLFAVFGGLVQFLVDWESVIASIGDEATYTIRGVILGVQVWSLVNLLFSRGR